MIEVRNLDALDATARDRLLRRGRTGGPGVADAVAVLIGDVRARGDAALLEQARRFDGVELRHLEVPRREWDGALERLEPALRSALEDAAAAIRTFHAAQRPAPLELETRPGVRVGRRPDPLRRVGVYAPGGRAAYPSSVLMAVVPARVAGVDEVVVCSPPGPDGRPHDLVLAACALAGADRLFAAGGAGAVAALACGTESVPRVDRIVGPGNAYVAEAKRQVAALVGIDSPAGPSELLVVADATADPEVVAGEMLAQAEHDPDAAVVLVSTDDRLARDTAAALARRAALEPRREIIEAALGAAGAILVAETLGAGLAFAEAYAPEHLMLVVDDPRAALDRVRCAGTVFLGPRSSVAFGDYATGANHVLPTGGLARSYSGLAVEDFIRWTTWQEVDDEGAASLAATAGTLADAEGLHAHAAAARWAGRGETVGATAPAVDEPPAPRAPYLVLERYDPVRPPLALDLSANTNLWGACPAAVAALRDPALEPTGYPTPYATGLREALAEAWDLGPAQVVTGCGSDDLIDSALRAWCRPGAVVAYPAPTFPMAEVFARMNDARPLPVPTEPDGTLEPPALARLAAADVVYLCRPNNPTGTQLPAATVDALLERARGLVIVDEAYGEFGGESMAARAIASGRGLVLRTFSKAYGLAGLRVGYALAAEPVARVLELSRGPYKVGLHAERAAIAAVRDGRDWMDEVVGEARRSRARLADALEARGLRVVRGGANFVLAGPRADEAGWALATKAALARSGIGVRAFPALPGFGDALRITVAPWPLMERLLTAMDAAVAAGASA